VGRLLTSVNCPLYLWVSWYSQ